jgi:hypothetical protein
MTYRSLPVAKLGSETIRAWKRSGLVFLFGSYISTFSPTNLPSGRSTTDALWNKILSATDLKYLGDDISTVPFEAIMQCYPGRASIRTIIRKLFNVNEPNPVHGCLFSWLESASGTSLISTNYDLALESLIHTNANALTIFDAKDFDEYKRLRSSGACPKVYFKIHGTAAPGCEQTIVCDLEAEGWLKPWKRELLAELTKDRTLILIGYSGSDFDICPELAKSTKQAETVWLQRKPEDLQPNAGRVLKERGGTLVYGDLIPFLRRLLDANLAASTPTGTQVNLDDFDSKFIDEWRLELLNWIACARLLEQSSATSKKGSAFKRHLFAHSGKYRDAIRELESESQVANCSKEERFRQRIRLAGARFIYGQHLRAWKMLNRLDREIMGDTSLGSDDTRALAIETRLMMYMRAAQVARVFRIEPILRYVQRKAAPLYEAARKILQYHGEWGRLEALQHNAERIGIATPDDLPLPSRRGYRSLGLVSMHVIATRDWLRSGRWRLNDRKQKEGRNCIAKAEQYGWHHEAWKFNWIMLWRGAGNKQQYFQGWWRHFYKTQYPITGRMFQLVINLIPVGQEGEFEDDLYWQRRTNI